jgi:hypothetical protein
VKKLIVFSDEELVKMIKGEVVCARLFGEDYVTVSETGMKKLEETAEATGTTFTPA